MTTITIEQDIDLPKRDFQNASELLEALQEVVPVTIYHADDDAIPPSSLEKIKRSQGNAHRRLTDFRG